MVISLTENQKCFMKHEKLIKSDPQIGSMLFSLKEWTSLGFEENDTVIWGILYKDKSSVLELLADNEVTALEFIIKEDEIDSSHIADFLIKLEDDNSIIDNCRALAKYISGNKGIIVYIENGTLVK